MKLKSENIKKGVSFMKKSYEILEGLEENNPDGYSVKNDTVDLSVIVDDIIAMNVPVSFLCEENCKGLCAGCGTNLNDGECKCKKQ